MSEAQHLDVDQAVRERPGERPIEKVGGEDVPDGNGDSLGRAGQDVRWCHVCGMHDHVRDRAAAVEGQTYDASRQLLDVRGFKIVAATIASNAV